MSWLGDWLREIILVVLLAAFVELLLPSKSMERYARLVLSLLILLTLLSPIVSLLKGDAVSELSLALGKQEKEGGLLNGAGKGANSLEKILADGQKLAQGRQEQSLKLAAEEVAGQMREQIASETGVRGVRVTVALSMDQSGDSGSGDIPVISAVTVTMPSSIPTTGPDAANGGASGAAVSQPIVIPPVEAVEVSIGKTVNPAPAQSGSVAGEGSPAGSEGTSGQAKSIATMLEQKWDLDPKVIHIQGQSTGDKKL
jgi:stage III sporulation protein AF